ncbi:MAG: GAF domain-containing protein [Deltaproteobacteria bacterium]|nr:GAF domain-containing protein [Deltaproteobacteria bacterium]
MERLLRQQQALRQVIEEISSELELRPLLTRIVRHACELTGANDGSIGLYDQHRNLIRTEAIYRMPPEELGAEMGPGEGLAGQVLLERTTVVHERYGSVPNPTLPELKANAVVGAPIFWRDRLVGFFGIGALPPRRFDANDIEVLNLFARHAAIAIENARRYRREKERAARLVLIAKVGRIIAAGLEREDLLQNAADAIHDLLGFANVAIPLLDPKNPEILILQAVGGHYRELVGTEHRLSVDEGIMGAAVRSGETQRVNAVHKDPRYLPTPGSKNITAELAVPILLGDQVLGVINAESSEPFSEEDATSLEITADHLAVAIKNASLFEQAQRGAVLEERQRLARELHDSVTQMLFSATLIGESVVQAFQRHPEEGERRITRLLELNRSALGEMRGLLRELQPADAQAMGGTGEFTVPTVYRVRRDGLLSVLRESLKEVEQDGVQVTCSANSYRRQAPDLEEALFRIAQEALHNMVKHSRATRVEVRLASDDKAIRLEVIDDGCGFDAQKTLHHRGRYRSEEGGMGLNSMRERARASGGTFRLESSPGYGTELRVELPIPRKKPAVPRRKTPMNFRPKARESGKLTELK